MSVSCSSASCSETGWPVSWAKAISLLRPPTSSRTLRLIVRGEKLDHIGRNLRAGEAREAVFEDLAAQVNIGGHDIGHKAHREAREQALLHPSSASGARSAATTRRLPALISASIV